MVYHLVPSTFSRFTSLWLENVSAVNDSGATIDLVSIVADERDSLHTQQYTRLSQIVLYVCFSSGFKQLEEQFWH